MGDGDLRRAVNLLLDTHALIWWLNDDPALGRRAREAIADVGHAVFVSADSAMEVTTKSRLGRLSEADALSRTFEAVLDIEGFRPMPVLIRHAALAGNLRIAHRDPFDRLLIAQSTLEDAVLVSNERCWTASA